VRLALVVAAACALAATAARASENPKVAARYSPAYQKCLESPQGVSTMGQIGCIGDELALQDKALNRAYAKAMADLTPGQKAKLQAAERAWVAFRDAECAAQEDEDWGTLSRVAANQCVLDRTIERAIELEAFPPDGS
jgi:uncharacterized protein YecT (DUF1311 family)